MTESADLGKKIQAFIEELHCLSRDKGNLFDPEVLSISQELDELIVEHYKLRDKSE